MCKWSDPFSRRVLIDRGLDQVRKHLYSRLQSRYYSVLKARPSKTKYERCLDKRHRDVYTESRPPVSMTVRSHLFPFRTQKLSSLVPKIVGWTRPVKIGRCRRLKTKPSRMFSRGFLACLTTRSRGNPFLPAYAGQKFFPPSILLGTKFSAEPRTRRGAARTLSAPNFPVCVPVVRTCRPTGTFLLFFHETKDFIVFVGALTAPGIYPARFWLP